MMDPFIRFGKRSLNLETNPLIRFVKQKILEIPSENLLNSELLNTIKKPNFSPHNRFERDFSNNLKIITIYDEIPNFAADYLYQRNRHT